METFSPEEIEGIVEAMSQKPLTDEERAKIPLRPPGSYTKIAKVAFSPLPGERPRPLAELTSKEMGDLEGLKAHVEVIFGKTHLSLKELAALEPGSLLPLEDLCDDLVDIYVNGSKIGRGEVIVVDGHFGVKIVSFTKN
jgi:flagellar motor switch protein FliN